MGSRRRVLVWAAAGSLGALVIAALVLLRGHAPPDSTNAGEWTCSMHPQVRRPGPGKCPLCGMDLVPVKQLRDEQTRLKERAGIETEPVAYRELFKELRTVGKVDYNERQVAFITARIAGRVDRVYADFTGIQVKKGDHLVDIYSPDLFVGQDELIRAAEEVGKGDAGRFAKTSLDAARTKLSLLGLLPEQIEQIEKTRKVQAHLTLYAPIGGTVIEKAVRAGQYVKEGDPLYRIAELDSVWLYLDVYEYDLSWVRFGQKVEVTVEAFPGDDFRGVLTFIDPVLDEKTRTVKVRVNLPNPDRKLRPGMYASARLLIRLRADGTPEPTGMEGKYVCPMHPEVVKDVPGKCAVCGMPLERVPEIRLRTGSGATTHADHRGHIPTPSKPREAPAGTEHAGHGKGADGAVVPATPPGKVLAVRATAVLDTGRRRVVFRKSPDGAFELIEVELGTRAEARDSAGTRVPFFPVLQGLKAGEEVVVRGAFLLDSQRQIEGMPSLLYPKGQAGVNLHAGHGAPEAARSPSVQPSADTHKH